MVSLSLFKVSVADHCNQNQGRFKLTNLINFCIRVIRAGRAFTRRLYDVYVS